MKDKVNRGDPTRRPILVKEGGIWRAVLVDASEADRLRPYLPVKTYRAGVALCRKMNPPPPEPLTIRVVWPEGKK